MVMPEYLDKHFYNKFFGLDEETILKLNKTRRDGSLNNVVVGLHSHFYAIELVEEEASINYFVYYINGKDKLTGDLLKLNLHDPERDTLLLIFSSHLADAYHLDILETFNTFQDQTRTMCEQLGYLTITANELQPYLDKNPTLIAKDVKGIIIVPFFYHLDLYQFLFGKPNIIIPRIGETYIYLMFNKRNKLIKIGKSRNPSHREKTLQAEEPEITMIATWKAPDKIERNLHKLYKDKRLRGEWFDLTFQELKEIKLYMKKLNIEDVYL